MSREEASPGAPFRVLQVGVGRFGQAHLRTWRKLGVALRVADRAPSLLVGLEEPCDTDWRALVEDVDAVDVVTPAPAHAEVVRGALEHGKHVLVEKPIAPTSEEGLALARLARERGRVLQVGHVFRFAPEAQAAAAALREGRIGPIRYVQATFSSFKRPRADGGLAISDGIHFVDLVSWLIGRQPEGVTAVLRDHLGRGMDDFSLLALDYGDAHALVEASCFRPEPRRDVQVVGREGALVCDLLSGGSGVRVFDQRHHPAEGGTWTAEDGGATAVPVRGGEALLAELDAFSTACARGVPCPDAADGVAGAAAVAVIEGALRSAREGRRVPVSACTL